MTLYHMCPFQYSELFCINIWFKSFFMRDFIKFSGSFTKRLILEELILLIAEFNMSMGKKYLVY